jgi:Ser/Thr protein kinase RdoA (MazF antagonist)
MPPLNRRIQVEHGLFSESHDGQCYDRLRNRGGAENFFYAPGEVQPFDLDQACYGWFLQDLVNPLYPPYVFPAVRISGVTTADLARFFRHLVAGYRTEQPLSAEQLRMADVLLHLKESFVYLILNAPLAQWAATLHLPVDILHRATAVMEHRLLTGAPVVDLDFTAF